jgi:CelD/BcsL family acetyltransferase involved in cellulose biosynthesis
MTPLAFRWLEFLGQHTGHSALDNLTGDFIVSSDADRELVIDAVCRALNGPLRALWDGISLKRFCAYSTSLSAFLKAFPQARAVQEEMSGFVAELGASFEDTWGQFDSKARKNLRRAIRLLDASGLPYHFETRDEIDASLLGEISVLHSGRQRLLKELGRNDRDDLLSGEVMLDRVGELLRAMARAGKLRIHLMRIDNALAAFSIVFGGRAGANSWLVAFDEAFSRFSPSRLMFEHMYRQEIERYGTPRVNLMLGHTQAKQDFSNRIYSSHTVEVLNVSSFSARLKTESLRIFRRVMR